MTMMTYDLSDDLQMAVRMMGDGRMTLTVWDDRLKERRCLLGWDEVRHLMHTLKACEQVSKEMKKMAGKDYTDEVLASKYLNACILDWGTKTSLRIWGVDHKPELAMPTQEIYAMVESYENKPTIANPSDPFDYLYIAKKRLLAILSKRMEDEKGVRRV